MCTDRTRVKRHVRKRSVNAYEHARARQGEEAYTSAWVDHASEYHGRETTVAVGRAFIIGSCIIELSFPKGTACNIRCTAATSPTAQLTVNKVSPFSHWRREYDDPYTTGAIQQPPSPRDQYLSHRSIERRHGIPGCVDNGQVHRTFSSPLGPGFFSPRTQSYRHLRDRSFDRNLQNQAAMGSRRRIIISSSGKVMLNSLNTARHPTSHHARVATILLLRSSSSSSSMATKTLRSPKVTPK